MFTSATPPLERVYLGERVSFLVLNRFEVAAVIPSVPYLILSITDPERPEATFAASPQQKAILRLQFHDKSGPRAVASGKTAMTREQARTIIAFVQAHLTEAQLIICQCEAGISRSAAVAAALSRILQAEDSFFFEHYAPNEWIYQTLLKAADGDNNATQ